MEEKFSYYLLRKLQEHEIQQSKRMSLRKFADYLGVSRPLLSYWLNGAFEPSIDNVKILAKKFGPEIYDVLGLPQPDPLLNFITSNWDNIPPENQQIIFNQINDYLAKQEEEFKKPLRGACETSTA